MLVTDVLMSSLLCCQEADPRHTAWRGAAMAARAAAAHDGFVTLAEWAAGGSRLLRERSLFLW